MDFEICYRLLPQIRFFVLYNVIMETEKTNKNIELLTCNEVAQMLKVKISTIYSWIFYKQLPSTIYRKLGRKPIFIRSEVEKWFLEGAELKKRKG